jgi:hypothetical protein
MVVFLSTGLLFGIAVSISAAVILLQGDYQSLWWFVGAGTATLALGAASVFTSVISKKKENMYITFFREKFGARVIERRE